MMISVVNSLFLPDQTHIMDHLTGKSIQRQTILRTVADDNLSLGNHKLISVADGVADSDAVTVRQLNELADQINTATGDVTVISNRSLD